MKLSHFTISQQGDSHIKSGKNCQDYSGSISITNQKLNTTFGVVAIADGVGSCDYSEYGSKIAVTTVLKVLEKDLSLVDHISDEGILSILKSAYTKANDEIEREAEMRELPFKLFDTTLTVTILTDSGTCYVGHIGDDGVVAFMADGTYSMITSRIEGEEANSVIPLSSTDSWTFGVAKKPVAALVLLTDGLLDKAVGSERMHNRVYYPFFKSLFEIVMETEEDVAELRDTWDGYLREKEFRDGYGVIDDITLALIQIPAILKNVKPVPFDEEKWNEDSDKAKQEIEEALSKNTQTRSERENDITPAEAIPGKETTQAADLSQTIQQATDNTSFQDAKNPHDDYSGLPQIEKGVISSIDYSNQDNSTLKKASRILIPAISIVLLLACGLVFRKVGYDAGVEAGKQQEQSSVQEQLDALQLAHEKDLKAEYDRGFHDAEQVLANGTEDHEDVTQSQAVSPEKYVIKRGQKGKIVEDIQTKLISKGWIITADGIYGELTEQAIREFQQINQIRMTGEVDIFTYWALAGESSKGKEMLLTDPDSTTETEELSDTIPEENEDEGNRTFDETLMQV